MNRSILHCDMNNFYASVECMLDPSLRKYPVAVCGSVEERHGIVLAKNYAAKAFDVKTGDAVWQAKQKCKDLVIVPPHYEEYIKYSKLARSVYSRFTDQVEPYGMIEVKIISSYSLTPYREDDDVGSNFFRYELHVPLGLPILELNQFVTHNEDGEVLLPPMMCRVTDIRSCEHSNCKGIVNIEYIQPLQCNAEKM